MDLYPLLVLPSTFLGEAIHLYSSRAVPSPTKAGADAMEHAEHNDTDDLFIDDSEPEVPSDTGSDGKTDEQVSNDDDNSLAFDNSAQAPVICSANTHDKLKLQLYSDTLSDNESETEIPSADATDHVPAIALPGPQYATTAQPVLTLSVPKTEVIIILSSDDEEDGGKK